MQLVLDLRSDQQGHAGFESPQTLWRDHAYDAAGQIDQLRAMVYVGNFVGAVCIVDRLRDHFSGSGALSKSLEPGSGHVLVNDKLVV
ncbi:MULTISPECIES: hypothetical protein [unclassified Paraburkholderia]|uniref:hypothetical protein n=1 Tax=unclassified Paraburkholderia TaxID=2615204 RepID=UPI002AB02EDC|nr:MULTISPECIES: hypothetical protein [unclassified Paraburkholderia]